jgi:hypothetical protein
LDHKEEDFKIFILWAITKNKTKPKTSHLVPTKRVRGGGEGVRKSNKRGKHGKAHYMQVWKCHEIPSFA